MLWQDWRLFRQHQVEPTTWLLVHLTRMIGPSIAAYTAFLVVNSSSRVSLLGWFLPTLLGVPLIVYWSRNVKKKKGR